MPKTCEPLVLRLFKQILAKCLPSPVATGRPTGPIDLWVGVHDRRIFRRDFPKDIFSTFWFCFSHDFFSLENRLEKSDDRVPLPIKSLGKSRTIGILCSPTYKLIGPVGLPVARKQVFEFSNQTFLKTSFGKSLTQIGILCTPYKFIGGTL